MSITVERLKAVVRYDPESGAFIWVSPTSDRVRCGAIAGSVTKLGYRAIMIDKKRYMAHRLAWLWVHGRWPNGEIDHINGDGLDNRISNLREATHAENMLNRKRTSTCRSGFKGVSWHKGGRKWKAQIGYQGKWYALGLYECPVEAHKAYVAAAHRLHGEFARID